MPEIRHGLESGWTIHSSYRHAEAKINVLNASFGSYVDRATGEIVDPWDLPLALKSDRTSDTQSFNIVATGGFPLLQRSPAWVVSAPLPQTECDETTDAATK